MQQQQSTWWYDTLKKWTGNNISSNNIILFQSINFKFIIYELKLTLLMLSSNQYLRSFNLQPATALKSTVFKSSA
jgi:hypothetical protein